MARISRKCGTGRRGGCRPCLRASGMCRAPRRSSARRSGAPEPAVAPSGTEPHGPPRPSPARPDPRPPASAEWRVRQRRSARRWALTTAARAAAAWPRRGTEPPGACSPPPGPAGISSIVLSAVSCITASACEASGSFQRTGQALNGEPLAEAWNGNAWTIQSAVKPLGAISNSFSAVSCVSIAFCEAVGSHRIPRATLSAWPKSGTAPPGRSRPRRTPRRRPGASVNA